MQRFAQVTNPWIDLLCKGVVMSVAITHGKKQSIYNVTEARAQLIHFESPVMNLAEMDYVKSLSVKDKGGFLHSTFSTRCVV